MVKSLPFPCDLKKLLGYQIKDLVLTDQNFIIEAASWTIPPSSISSFQRYSICDGDVYIVGGYGVTKAGAVFTRTYKNLEEHSMIFFSIHFWLIDSWDSGDTFYVKFDDVLLNFFPWQNAIFVVV